jgi:hypothetical protein
MHLTPGFPAKVFVVEDRGRARSLRAHAEGMARYVRIYPKSVTKTPNKRGSVYARN